jgi:hypothetical protein
MKRNQLLLTASAMIGLMTATSWADVPVYDSRVHRQTRAITKNTDDILKSDKKIEEQTKEILEAVTGNRTDGNQAQGSALGGGFKFGQAPKFSDILGGGGMNFGSLPGEFQQIAATVINGMKFVKELKTFAEGTEKTSNQAGYESLVNTATSLAGIVSGSQSAVASRSSAFQSVGSKIGQETDIKGAVAMNSMVSLQQAQTMNEAIGAITALGAAEQAKLMKRLAEETGGMELLEYDPK